MERARITVFDTTLRDGEQSPGCSMNVQEKLRLAHQLDRLGRGCDRSRISDRFGWRLRGGAGDRRGRPAPDHRRPGARLRAGHRARLAGAEGRGPSAHPRLPGHFRHSPEIQAAISREQCLEQARDAVRLAKSFCQDVEFSPEDATRTDPDFLCQVLEAVVEAGATTLNIPDTVGYTMPAEFGELIQSYSPAGAGHRECDHLGALPQRSGLGGGEFSGGGGRGARQVECTINGIGERAGNASLEEIVMAMRVRPDRYAV